jgi:hypothetical protein
VTKLYEGQSNDFHINREVPSDSNLIHHPSPSLETTIFYADQSNDFQIYHEMFSGLNPIYHPSRLLK